MAAAAPGCANDAAQGLSKDLIRALARKAVSMTDGEQPLSKEEQRDRDRAAAEAERKAKAEQDSAQKQAELEAKKKKDLIAARKKAVEVTERSKQLHAMAAAHKTRKEEMVKNADREAKELSNKPKTIKGTEDILNSSNRNATDVYDRLYNQRDVKEKKIAQLRADAEQKELELMKDPEVSQASTDLVAERYNGKTVADRLYDQRNKHQELIDAKQKEAAQEELNLMQDPVLNENSRSLVADQTKTIHERNETFLHNKLAAQERKRAEAEKEELGQMAKPQLTKKGENYQRRHEDRLKWANMRQQKVAQLDKSLQAEESTICPFRPAICPGTQKLTRNRPKSAGAVHERLHGAQAGRPGQVAYKRNIGDGVAYDTDNTLGSSAIFREEGSRDELTLDTELPLAGFSNFVSTSGFADDTIQRDRQAAKVTGQRGQVSPRGVSPRGQASPRGNPKGQAKQPARPASARNARSTTPTKRAVRPPSHVIPHNEEFADVINLAKRFAAP